MKNRQNISGKFYAMRNWPLLLGCLLAVQWLNACKKTHVPGTASLTVFNGVTGSSEMVTNFSGTTPIVWYKNAGRLYYGGTSDPSFWAVHNNYRFGWNSGDQRVAFFEYPDTLAHDKPVVDLQLNLPVASVNTLFLSGSIDNPDTVLIREQLPYYNITDSVAGIRVINLVKGFTASVNLQGKPNGSEAGPLAYKAVSPFVQYDVKKEPVTYVFEIRDASTGNIVSTQTIDTKDRDIGFGIANLYRFRNFTIIIYGEMNNTGLLSSALMINY